jgi:hypothetical protein
MLSFTQHVIQNSFLFFSLIGSWETYRAPVCIIRLQKTAVQLIHHLRSCSA